MCVCVMSGDRAGSGLDGEMEEVRKARYENVGGFEIDGCDMTPLFCKTESAIYEGYVTDTFPTYIEKIS